MRLFTPILALVCVACGPPTGSSGGDSAATRCSSNDDCRLDFVCQNRRCRRGGGTSQDAGVIPPADAAANPDVDGGVQSDGGVTPLVDAGSQSTVCGNGLRELGESCDDGNVSNNDSCLNDCSPNICGDGFLNPAAEECDDENVTPGDGCSAECRIERGPVCGNGELEEGEQCDDGNRDIGDGCDSDCQNEQGGPPDHGDVPEDAMRVTVPANVDAAIDRTGDRDYFRFFATSTASYSVFTEGQTDTVCAVEFNGNLMGTDDDSGDGLNCRISAQLTAGRTYYVLVSGAGQGTGPYVLRITR
ncbi:MAG: DUF4215 domain-containing protein [Myxococcota bacterium]|nr:DUF4215 domain-containing protein [Myxococcota bacterium]